MTGSSSSSHAGPLFASIVCVCACVCMAVVSCSSCKHEHALHQAALQFAVHDVWGEFDACSAGLKCSSRCALQLIEEGHTKKEKKRKEKKRKEKKRKEKTMLKGVNLMRSQVLYGAAQVIQSRIGQLRLAGIWSAIMCLCILTGKHMFIVFTFMTE